MTGKRLRSELEIIPRWARILAGLAAAVPVGMWLAFMAPLRFGRPDIGLQIGTLLLSFFLGSVFAGLMLLTGYVNRDARRRGMSAALWTLLVLVIPNALGFVVYFFARQPLQTTCPQCAAAVPVGVSFCGSCGFKVAAVCPQCRRHVSGDQPYCPHCGHAVAGAAAPPA